MSRATRIKPVTARQVRRFIELTDELGITSNEIEALYRSGLLADLLSVGQLHRINRETFREAIGLFRFDAVLHDDPIPFDSTLDMDTLLSGFGLHRSDCPKEFVLSSCQGVECGPVSFDLIGLSGRLKHSDVLEYHMKHPDWLPGRFATPSEALQYLRARGWPIGASEYFLGWRISKRDFAYLLHGGIMINEVKEKDRLGKGSYLLLRKD